MAKNWTLKLASEALNGTKEMKDEFAVDSGRRFPLATSALVILHTLAGLSEAGKTAFIDVFDSTPEWMTIRKIESVLKSEASDEDEEDAEPVKKEKKEKAPKEDKKEKAPKAKKEKFAKLEDDDDEEDEPVAKKKDEKKKKSKKDEDDDEDWD